MTTQFDARQTISRDTLDEIGDNTAGDQLDALLRSINSELTIPLRLIASSPVSRIVHVGAISVTNPEQSRVRTVPPIGGAIPTFTGATITVPSANNNNITNSTSGPSVLLNIPSGDFANVGVNLDSSGNLQITVGTAASTAAAAGVPSINSGTYGIGFFTVQNISGTIQTITNSNIVEYNGIGGQSLSGSFVDLSSNQSIAGNKTFTAQAYFNSNVFIGSNNATTTGSPIDGFPNATAGILGLYGKGDTSTDATAIWLADANGSSARNYAIINGWNGTANSGSLNIMVSAAQNGSGTTANGNPYAGNTVFTVASNGQTQIGIASSSVTHGINGNLNLQQSSAGVTVSLFGQSTGNTKTFGKLQFYDSGSGDRGFLNSTSDGSGNTILSMNGGNIAATSSSLSFSTTNSGTTSVVGTVSNAGVWNLKSLSIGSGGVTATVLKNPTQQIFLSGSGTYTTPAGVLWLRIRMIGGGGGGGPGGPINTTGGGTGGNTTFGTSFLTCNGGAAAGETQAGAAGGSATIGSGAIGIAMTGNSGTGSVEVGGTGGPATSGGLGGAGVFGGVGVPGFASGAGNSVANSGAGGSGGGSGSTGADAGGGGGAGGFIDALIITSIASTYSYSIGSGGVGGTGTTSGGVGGSGQIIVEEHYI